MKKFPFLLIIALCGLASQDNLQAQFSMVYSLGIAPQQSPAGHYIFVNRSLPESEFTFDLAQVKASGFIGAGTRYSLDPFFLMAEAQYNKREYVYDVEYTYPEFVRSAEVSQFSETMHVINVPISIGVDLGIIEVTSGLLPQIIAGHQTDLGNIDGFTSKLNTVRFGWQSGIAAKVANLRLGINWQMDSNNYGDHLYINDQQLSLSGRSSRIVGLLSYAF